MVWADGNDPASFEAAVTPKTKLVFIESIANPGGIVLDVAAIAAVAKKAGIPLWSTTRWPRPTCSGRKSTARTSCCTR